MAKLFTWEDISVFLRAFEAKALRSQMMALGRKDAVEGLLRMCDIGNVGSKEVATFSSLAESATQPNHCEFLGMLRAMEEFAKQGKRRAGKRTGKAFSYDDVEFLHKAYFGVNKEPTTSGLVDINDLHHVLTKISPQATKQDAQTLMDKLDARSGYISFDHFLKGMAFSNFDINISGIRASFRVTPADERKRAAATQRPSSRTRRGDAISEEESTSNLPLAIDMPLSPPPGSPARRLSAMTPRGGGDVDGGPSPADDQVEALIAKAFSSADQDHSGTIDAEELHDILSIIKPDISMPQAKRIYAEIDTNRSGTITFPEFREAVFRFHWDLSKVPLRKVGSLSNSYEWEIPFDELELGLQLGEGTFGVVYKAKWRGLTVAVKMVKLHTVEDEGKIATVDEGVLEDFRKEIGLLSGLRHPHVVLFMGACTKAPNICMVTEFLEGGSMFEIVHEKKKRLSLRQWSAIAKQTAFGMNYLHMSNIIHRDLKSMNLLVDKHLNVKLCDFGLSCVKPDQGLSEQVGTPLWMSPELLLAKSYSEKADVYAFAICCWEFLTGELPFGQCSDVDELTEKVTSGWRPSFPAKTPTEIVNLLRQCWATKPERRPNFAQIITTLETIGEIVRSDDARRREGSPDRAPTPA